MIADKLIGTTERFMMQEHCEDRHKELHARGYNCISTFDRDEGFHVLEIRNRNGGL